MISKDYYYRIWFFVAVFFIYVSIYVWKHPYTLKKTLIIEANCWMTVCLDDTIWNEFNVYDVVGW